MEVARIFSALMKYREESDYNPFYTFTKEDCNGIEAETRRFIKELSINMLPEDKELFVKEKAREHIAGTDEKILWSLHAVRKLMVEGLRKKEVEDSLKACIIIEDYAMEGRPLPGCLVLGFVGANPVHAVIAIDIDFDRIFVITVYKPSSERWENDWKTRKAKD